MPGKIRRVEGNELDCQTPLHCYRVGRIRVSFFFRFWPKKLTFVNLDSWGVDWLENWRRDKPSCFCLFEGDELMCRWIIAQFLREILTHILTGESSGAIPYSKTDLSFWPENWQVQLRRRTDGRAQKFRMSAGLFGARQYTELCSCCSLYFNSYIN